MTATLTYTPDRTGPPGNPRNCVGDLESTVQQSGTGAGRQVCNGAGCYYPENPQYNPRNSAAENRAFINQVMNALKGMDLTGTGSCVSASAGFIVRGAGSACTFKIDAVDARIWALSLGLGAESNALSASATADTAFTNAETEFDLAGRGRCFAVSGGAGPGATGGICGGVKDGVFNGVVVAYSGVGFGGGVLPVDVSVTETWTWVKIFEQMTPRTYRNPDGSCMSGGNAGYCGQGSMNAGGVPGWPP